MPGKSVGRVHLLIVILVYIKILTMLVGKEMPARVGFMADLLLKQFDVLSHRYTLYTTIYIGGGVI